MKISFEIVNYVISDLREIFWAKINDILNILNFFHNGA